MPEYLAPGVYIEELPTGTHPIEAVATSVVGFIGVSTQPGLLSAVTSTTEFERSAPADSTQYLRSAVHGFFQNGGTRCSIVWIAASDPIDAALAALSEERISILCCPDEQAFTNAAAMMVADCEQRKDRFCILQSPLSVIPHATHEPPVHSSYAAYYHPWLTVPGPDGNVTLTVPPSGHVAGIYARIDTNRGPWAVPADVLLGVRGLSQDIDETDAHTLTTRGINVLRNVPGRGIRIWGGRTTSADLEWKYVNIRRLFIFIEESLTRGLQWTVSEPQGIRLWETVRAVIENFLQGVWKAGALVGEKSEEAFFVRCDRTTMTQEDVDAGRLVALVGVSAVRPAEFVILRVTCQSTSPTGP
jgi:uncharacterized protein